MTEPDAPAPQFRKDLKLLELLSRGEIEEIGKEHRDVVFLLTSLGWKDICDLSLYYRFVRLRHPDCHVEESAECCRIFKHIRNTVFRGTWSSPNNSWFDCGNITDVIRLGFESCGCQKDGGSKNGRSQGPQR